MYIHTHVCIYMYIHTHVCTSWVKDVIAQSNQTLCDPSMPGLGVCSTPGFPVLHYFLGLLKLMSIESMMPSNHLILCCPLLLLPSVFCSMRVFSNGSTLLIRWPKYWSLSLSISPSSEYSGLISLQPKGVSRVFSNTTIWKHQFFGAQSLLWSNSNIYTWLPKKNIALTIWIFVGKVMSLLFNTVSRFVKVPHNCTHLTC